MKPGLSVASAQAHIDALVASLKKQYPPDYPAQAAWNIRLVPGTASHQADTSCRLVIIHQPQVHCGRKL